MNRLKRSVSLITAAMLLLSGCGGSTGSSASSDRGPYETDGELTGSAQGMNGPVPVTVTVENGNITAVVVGENTETPGIGSEAIDKLPGEIVKANGTEVDGVSGATITSNAIKKAVNIALGLEQAEVSATIVDGPTEADVVVVGAGVAGLTAAVRTAEMGHTAILIEQSSDTGGSSKMAGGAISGAVTKLQEAQGIKDSYEWMYKDIIDIAGGIQNVYPDLVWTHVQRSGEMIDWMVDFLGVKFKDEITTGVYTPLNALRCYSTESGGVEYANALREKVDDYSDQGLITLYLNTKVDGLVEDDDGNVTGVTAGDKTFTGKGGVILATGGYGYNEEWVKKYNFEHSKSLAPETATGDGYDFAEEVGAKLSHMDYLPGYGGAVDVNDGNYTAAVRANVKGWSGDIWVDVNGERKIDEAGSRYEDRAPVWEKSDHNYVYMILTQEMIDNAEEPLFNVDKNNGNWDRFNEELEKGDCVWSASSIKELAEKAGIDPDGLEATVTKYNEDVANGKDTVFGRTEKLMPIESKTYYAVRTVPYILLTSGGVLVNTKAQVLREDDSVVNGLYAAGELMGPSNLEGYASYGGIADSICMVWGTIAAESAVSEAAGEEIHVPEYKPISTELPDLTSIKDPSAK